MIPKEDEIKNLISQQQSKVVLRRDKEHYIPEPEYGECQLCKRHRKMYSARFKLCITCYNWSRGYVIKKYGNWHPKYMGDAFVQFKKPIPCRFFHRCGHIIPRVVGDKINLRKKTICPDCFEIYNAGYIDARISVKGRMFNSIQYKDDDHAKSR